MELEVSDGSCTPTARAHQIAQYSKYSKYSKYHNFTTMDSIEAALEALSLQSKPNYTKTAKAYNVNRSTLSRRHRQVTGSKASGYNSQALLNNQQSRTLINYINELSERGLPPTVAMV